VRLEYLGKLIQKMILLCLEHVTLGFVAQCLNHYARACPAGFKSFRCGPLPHSHYCSSKLKSEAISVAGLEGV
jgi:hypothetical protein